MVQKTKIEWVGQHNSDGTFVPGYTSNPLYVIHKKTGKRGWFCVKVSLECNNCYSEVINRMWGNGLSYTSDVAEQVEWKLNEKELAALRKLKSPSVIFLCDMTDLFHKDVPVQFISAIFKTMFETPHTYKVLTKRPHRMRAFISSLDQEKIQELLKKIWLGVSVGHPDYVWRIEELIKTPAIIRFVSYEPALAHVDFRPYLSLHCPQCHRKHIDAGELASEPHLTHKCEHCGNEWEPFDIPTVGRHGVDWIIAGAESGRGARPMQQDWVKSVKDQCVSAGVAIFYKQDADRKGKKISLPILDGQRWTQYPTSL
jgi:protein gp37